eukprot:3588888-Rhodomonas_salina.1
MCVRVCVCACGCVHSVSVCARHSNAGRAGASASWRSSRPCSAIPSTTTRRSSSSLRSPDSFSSSAPRCASPTLPSSSEIVPWRPALRLSSMHVRLCANPALQMPHATGARHKLDTACILHDRIRHQRGNTMPMSLSLSRPGHARAHGS